jgi:hypothetical protein
MMGSTCHVVLSVASGARNANALFFMFRWDQYGFDIKRVRTCYTKLVLHSVGFAGDVVHSGASEARNIDALFFILGVGPVRITQKAHWNMLHQTSVCAFRWTSGSRSALRCV